MGGNRDVVDVFTIGPLIMPLVIDVPSPPADRTAQPDRPRRRRPNTPADHNRGLRARHAPGRIHRLLTRDRDTLLKRNLAWTNYFPSCSSQPWQVDAVIATMLRDGFERRLIPVENRTVVTDPRKGCPKNRWEGVLDRFGLTFTPLPKIEWRARLMGFDPTSIPFLRMAHERGLGIAVPRDIDLTGHDVSYENFGFETRRSPVIWGDQMIRKGFLRPLERVLLHSRLMVWGPFASNVYHDAVWYPTIGESRIRSFIRTEWGTLFRKY